MLFKEKSPCRTDVGGLKLDMHNFNQSYSVLLDVKPMKSNYPLISVLKYKISPCFYSLPLPTSLISMLIFKPSMLKYPTLPNLEPLSLEFWHTLRKHAYSNILNFLPPKNENFQIKSLLFFIFLLKNKNCGYSSRRF